MMMQFQNFQQEIRDGLVGYRMMAMLSGFFGLLAIILVAVGLYGVLSYFITQRRNEIGIRIALGAGRWQVISLVLGNTTAMFAVGLFVGTVLALLVGSTASTMLFGSKRGTPQHLSSLLFCYQSSRCSPVGFRPVKPRASIQSPPSAPNSSRAIPRVFAP